MAFYYDHIDELGSIVERNVRLLPTTKALPIGHKWIKHVHSLEEVKPKKREKIHIDRNKQLTTSVPVSVNGTSYLWQADEKSQQLILATIVLAVTGIQAPPPTWRTEDNQDVPITLVDIQNIARAMAIQTGQSFIKSWTLKAILDRVTTVEEVEAIQW